MISGGEVMVDLDNIATINQWPISIILIEDISFMGESHYLRKFMETILVVATPLQAMTTKERVFIGES
jgi:hypothetical protein